MESGFFMCLSWGGSEGVHIHLEWMKVHVYGLALALNQLSFLLSQYSAKDLDALNTQHDVMTPSVDATVLVDNALYSLVPLCLHHISLAKPQIYMLNSWVSSVLVPKKLKAVLVSHIKGQISSTLNIWLSPSNGDFIFSLEFEELPSGGGALGSEESEEVWVCHYGGEKVRWAEEGSNIAR